jgi:hypothetical protein
VPTEVECRVELALVAPRATGAPELDAIAPRCAAEQAVAADAVAAGILV